MESIMDIEDIVKFWQGQQDADEHGRWTHRLDHKLLDVGVHSFNLDHPVSPYVGDVLTAPVIILGANGGYHPDITPTEFPDVEAESAYISRVDDPSAADWSFVSRYYDRTNYGHLVAAGKAVFVNACAYRSPKLSEEADNRAMIKRLPSTIFTRRWLLEAVLPLAATGERLIVVKRGGQWKLPATFATTPGVIVDPAPVSPQITSVPLARMIDFLSSRP